jgi:hypothetical protein
MSDRVCAAPLVRRSEFAIVTDPVTHTTARQFGLCGPTSDNSALASATGTEPSINSVYGWMRANSDCSQNGASTLSENRAACEHFGATVVDQLGFASALAWADVEAFIRKHAGVDPIVYETSKGQAQVDALSGLGENAVNLQFHFPAGLAYHAGGASDFAGGKVLPEGMFVADGCSFAGGNSGSNGFNAADVLQFYTMGVLQAAALVGLFALKGRNTMLQISQIAAYFAANADGSWHCKPTNTTLRGGMQAFYQNFVSPSGSLNGFSDAGLPLTNEIAVGSPAAIQPTIQVFERGVYLYDPNRVIDNPPGASGPVYKAHLNRPEVLSALGAVLKVNIPPAPVPALHLNGASALLDGKGNVIVTLPYDLA